MIVGGVALLLIAMVAGSRLYLGAHYLSDVLGAFAESMAWLALCITGVNVFRRRRLAEAETLSGG
jgi:undecaprenyl-diphosphatase